MAKKKKVLELKHLQRDILVYGSWNPLLTLQKVITSFSQRGMFTLEKVQKVRSVSLLQRGGAAV